MRSKAHTALTGPLVLHQTRIYKRARKKIIINGRMPFFIVNYHSSLVKAAMNAARVVKCAMVLAKRAKCILFSTVKGGMNILRSYLNCSTIVNWKTRKRTNTDPSRWTVPLRGLLKALFMNWKATLEKTKYGGIPPWKTSKMGIQDKKQPRIVAIKTKKDQRCATKRLR